MDERNTVILSDGPRGIRAAVGLLRAGELVAFPTETVYGLGADARSDRAVAGIFAAKGRPAFNPLIVHVADLAAAEGLAVFPDEARALAARFWPGPLTLVLPRRPDAGLAERATAGLGAARQHLGQRSGPEAGGQRAGLVREDGEAFGGGEVGDMHDERVDGRPPLGGKDPRHRAVAPGVGPQPVDGLGRKGDQLTRAQEARRGAEATLAAGQDDGIPLGHRRSLDRPPRRVNLVGRRPDP